MKLVGKYYPYYDYQQHCGIYTFIASSQWLWDFCMLVTRFRVLSSSLWILICQDCTFFSRKLHHHGHLRGFPFHQFANIFSHSAGCFLVLLMVSFAVQKALSLIRFYLFIFYFNFLCFRRQGQKNFCFKLFQKVSACVIL